MERCLKPSDCLITCTIHSKHPLALSTIQRALASDCDLRKDIKQCSIIPKGTQPETPYVLIVDTCSVGNWPELIQEGRSAGGYAISLLSPDAHSRGEDLKMLYMGVAGIVAFTDELETILPRAVRAVAEGKLWVRRETLERYVQETNHLWAQRSAHIEPFTEREQQILEFLRQGFSNRQIASATGISERTAKFHVSNILKKYQLDNRKKLQIVSTHLTLTLH
jgi:DNA-binding NarL/FixJ family response regulator